MYGTPSASPQATKALELVSQLQDALVQSLVDASDALGIPTQFRPIDWLRDEGRHGGGRRYVAEGGMLQRASVNLSAVHYDDLPHKRLRCATALSTIVHPDNPHAPSMHMHISHTEMRDGTQGWRIMADLNPSIPDQADRERFQAALRDAAPALFEDAAAHGDRYFAVPALRQHRGVAHYYLEGHHTGDMEADRATAEAIGRAVIGVYAELVRAQTAAHPAPSPKDRAAQLAYHTLYLFQVLTLDRGTTSGLLVHAQNDLGIMGSLPSYVDRALLLRWAELCPAPQDVLTARLAAVLRQEHPSAVDDATRLALAATVRAHYAEHPEALALQARGDVVPPTVQNHR